MTSTLKTDTLTGVSTAGSISVTGEGNSTATNLQQGLAKCWLKYEQDTPATLDSFNVTNVTDVSEGIFLLNVANDFSSVNHVVSITKEAESNLTNNTCYNEIANSTAGVDKIYTVENGAVIDCKNVNVADFGDLA
jgi:pantothenate kinase